MRILFANKFFFKKGGAELVFLETADLLKAHGQDISFFAMAHARNQPAESSSYFVSHVDYEKSGPAQSLKAAGRLVYSWESRRNIERLLAEHKPDIAHLHNIYHQISPSILHSLKKFRVPVVMTLHDYKLVCASYSMFADGKVCEACKGGRYYQCFLKKCVKNSRVKSLLNTFEMTLHHNLLHIYDLVDIFISPSRFLIDKVHEMGFKGEIVHLPNFVAVEGFQPQYGFADKAICYVGRLDKTKGVATLIKAVEGLDVELRIIGEGPFRGALEALVEKEGIRNVRFAGYMIGDKLRDEIQSSIFTVIPSEWYENNPRSVIESFAWGKPVIGARIGGIPELVRDGATGFTFTPFQVDDLREKLERLLRDPDLVVQLGKNARRMVEQELNADVHYENLMKIYSKAQAKAASRSMAG